MRFPQSKLWETDYTVPPAFFFYHRTFRAFHIIVSTWNTKQGNAIYNYFLNRLIHQTLFFLECLKGMWLPGRHVDQRLQVREWGTEQQLSFTTVSRMRIYIGCDIMSQVGLITQIYLVSCQIQSLCCHSFSGWDLIYTEYHVKNIAGVCTSGDLFWSLGWEDPLEESKATHSSILAWRILIDREAWQATVHGATESWTQLSD